LPGPGIKNLLTTLELCVGNAEAAQQTVTMWGGQAKAFKGLNLFLQLNERDIHYISGKFRNK